MKKKLNLIAFLGITAAAAGSLTFGSQKQADAAGGGAAGAPPVDNKPSQEPSCLVTNVQYSNDELVIACSSGKSYIAWGPGWTACNSRQSEDSLKVFSSLAQSALLSGKHLLINYLDHSPDCGSVANPQTSVNLVALF